MIRQTALILAVLSLAHNTPVQGAWTHVMSGDCKVSLPCATNRPAPANCAVLDYTKAGMGCHETRTGWSSCGWCHYNTPQCPFGYHAQQVSESCCGGWCCGRESNICLKKQHCPAVILGTCHRCNSGYHLDIHTGMCKRCPYGYYCDDGIQAKTFHGCGPGKFRHFATTTSEGICAPCPKDHVKTDTSDNNGNWMAQCSTCPAGSYAVSAQACQQCPKNPTTPSEKLMCGETLSNCDVVRFDRDEFHEATGLYHNGRVFEDKFKGDNGSFPDAYKVTDVTANEVANRFDDWWWNSDAAMIKIIIDECKLHPAPKNCAVVRWNGDAEGRYKDFTGIKYGNTVLVDKYHGDHTMYVEGLYEVSDLQANDVAQSFDDWWWNFELYDAMKSECGLSNKAYARRAERRALEILKQ